MGLFAIADALFQTDVSATRFSLNLQMLLSLPVMYNCIYILPFLEFEDASFANFSSASHVFYDLRMLLIETMNPQLALSMTCRYSSTKFCIFNSQKSSIADTATKFCTPNVCPTKFSSLIHQICDNVLQENIGYEF